MEKEIESAARASPQPCLGANLGSESRPDSVTLTAKPPSVPHQRAEQQSSRPAVCQPHTVCNATTTGHGLLAPNAKTGRRDTAHSPTRPQARKGQNARPPAPSSRTPGASSPVISLRPGHRHPGPEQRHKLRLTIIKYASSGEICPLPPSYSPTSRTPAGANPTRAHADYNIVGTGPRGPPCI